MNELDLAKYKELYKAPFRLTSYGMIKDANDRCLITLSSYELRGDDWELRPVFGHWLVSKLNEEWEKK